MRFGRGSQSLQDEATFSLFARFPQAAKLKDERLRRAGLVAGAAQSNPAPEIWLLPLAPRAEERWRSILSLCKKEVHERCTKAFHSVFCFYPPPTSQHGKRHG